MKNSKVRPKDSGRRDRHQNASFSEGGVLRLGLDVPLVVWYVSIAHEKERERNVQRRYARAR